MDASNLLKPMLASGEIRCMGSTTYQEYRGIFDKDRALSTTISEGRCKSEPSVDDTYLILKGLEVEVRGAPQPEIHRSQPTGRRRAGAKVHQRSVHARQSHRCD